MALPPAKACCITVKPMSRTISTSPPARAGWTTSLTRLPVIVSHAANVQTSSSTHVGISMMARS